MRPFKESSMASFAKEHGINRKLIEEKIEEKVKSKYSKSVIENPPRKLMPRWFVLQKKPTTRVGFDKIVSYELVVYTITETLPNPAEAKVNFLKVFRGQIVEQNEVGMGIKIARRHWKAFKEKGWTELPKTSWPKWLKDNVAAYGLTGMIA